MLSLAPRRYVLKKQFLKFIGDNFRVYDEAGSLALFVHQKGFRLKEDIRIHAGEGGPEVLAIRARTIMDFRGIYDLWDVLTGERLAVYQRMGFQSLARDQWNVMDGAERPLGTIVEDSLGLALVRRFLSNLVPQSYDFLIGDRQVMDFRQRFNPFVYHLDIDFTPAPGAVEPRIGLGAAILLAAIEGRQG